MRGVGSNWAVDTRAHRSKQWYNTPRMGKDAMMAPYRRVTVGLHMRCRHMRMQQRLASALPPSSSLPALAGGEPSCSETARFSLFAALICSTSSHLSEFDNMGWSGATICLVQAGRANIRVHVLYFLGPLSSAGNSATPSTSAQLPASTLHARLSRSHCWSLPTWWFTLFEAEKDKKPFSRAQKPT